MVETGILVLFLNLEEELPSLTIECDVRCGFFVNATLHFVVKGAEFLPNAFSASVEKNSVGFKHGAEGWGWSYLCFMKSPWQWGTWRMEGLSQGDSVGLLHLGVRGLKSRDLGALCRGAEGTERQRWWKQSVWKVEVHCALTHSGPSSWDDILPHLS